MEMLTLIITAIIITAPLYALVSFISFIGLLLFLNSQHPTFIVSQREEAWVYGYYGQYYVTAKVYQTPSRFGIAQGRVSKLSIYNQQDEEIYNYSRGLDFDNAPTGLLANLLPQLEQLPC